MELYLYSPLYAFITRKGKTLPFLVKSTWPHKDSDRSEQENVETDVSKIREHQRGSDVSFTSVILKLCVLKAVGQLVTS